MKLAVSIVLFHNGEELLEAIQSVLNSEIELKLYLIDNSKTDKLKKLANDSRISYTFNNKNLGYGTAHNMALQQSIKDNINYHIVMNPDISFKKGTLEKMVAYLEQNPDVGSLMPKIHYRDGSIQRLCRLLPTPFDLIGRRFLSKTEWASKQNKRYELHDFDYNTILNTPCLSGCFMFMRTDVLKEIGLFDERFFVYLEDYDLSRRINQHAKTLFFPEVSILHGYVQGSYKELNLLGLHIHSAIKYFNKWGWLVDRERNRLNQEVLETIQQSP
ncbi:glycosyltransferase family 2 protein [Pedobacter frigiditerrae]|uniref:glycosyltransferase family 2 protein n=1 Tax=Pedobacter frigiditerrae TaxID=2530452 RepID=UPI00292F045B|nr:glycosyltransferase family 2 protein [Pedobacter frigiditerrae]